MNLYKLQFKSLSLFLIELILMATRTSVPLEPETGTELCRVKLEGSLGGYRSDILTENLSEREGAIYKCTRCNGIMKDASISKGKQICVCCKREDENTHPHESINDTILSLKCACPLSKRGCEWLGRLEIVENHLTTCGHVYESCQLLCGVVTTRDEMGRHVREECSQREEACLHCSGVHKVCEMVEHVKVCGKVFVLCELGCGTRVRRESILFHLSSECSEESVVCPYEKYRCEVVELKRRELKQHLEENWRTHTELKLNAMEENYLGKNELLERQMHELESKFKIEMDIKNRKLNAMEEKVEFLEKQNETLMKESELFQGILIRQKIEVKWTLKEILKKFKPNLGHCYLDHYVVAGYRFRLFHRTDSLNFMIKLSPRNGDNYNSLEWPFKAIFITKLICHRNTKDSLIFKSPVIVIQKKEFTSLYNPKQIASIPLSTDLKDFIKSDNLDLEITAQIF